MNDLYQIEYGAQGLEEDWHNITDMGITIIEETFMDLDDCDVNFNETKVRRIYFLLRK